MFRKFFSHFLQFDIWMGLAILLLISLGLIMLGSIEFNADTTDSGFFYKQLIFAGLGIILFLFFSFLDYRWLRSYAYLFYIISAILLILVLIFGTTIRGTTGWFQLGFFSLQPVELVKIFLIIFLAYFLSEQKEELLHWRNLGKLIALVAALVILVMLQPDFGSALIFIIVWLGLLFISAVKKTHFLIIIIGLACLAVLSWFFLFKDYQRDRLLTFVDPGRDPLGSGYNLSQSLIAVGSGKIWGRGLGLGPQSQLNFLPEQTNDFIFASLAEELGLVGAGTLIIIFFFLFYRLFRLIRRAPDDFSLFLTVGILLSLFSQFFINIGMNLGIMPITGLPLPFVSAGGSSLVSSLIMMGIVQSIYRRQK